MLTPKDFERIQRLKAQRAEVASLRGAKRKRAEAELEAEAEAEAEALVRTGAALEGEAVDEMDLLGVKAKKAATREEKLASTLAGREDRGKFGGGSKGKKTGGKSNKEKKKNNPFMMAKNKLGVRNKSRDREANNRRAQRRAKKMQRGKVKK